MRAPITVPPADWLESAYALMLGRAAHLRTLDAADFAGIVDESEVLLQRHGDTKHFADPVCITMITGLQLALAGSAPGAHLARPERNALFPDRGRMILLPRIGFAP